VICICFVNVEHDTETTLPVVGLTDEKVEPSWQSICHPIYMISTSVSNQNENYYYARANQIDRIKDDRKVKEIF